MELLYCVQKIIIRTGNRKILVIKNNLSFNNVGGQLKQIAPRCSTLACELFQAENKQGPKDSGKKFNLPSSYLEQFR